LRFVARTLAANGIAVLRFDLPGTGDSSGSPSDSGLLTSWIRAAGDAIVEIRSVAEVAKVAVFGIGLGGVIAVSSVASGSDADALVLWGTPSSGRGVLRELRAFARMEQKTSANGAPPPPSVPSFEAGGFVVTPELERYLEGLDLPTLLPRPPLRRAPSCFRAMRSPPTANWYGHWGRRDAPFSSLQARASPI